MKADGGNWALSVDKIAHIDRKVTAVHGKLFASLAAFDEGGVCGNREACNSFREIVSHLWGQMGNVLQEETMPLKV